MLNKLFATVFASLLLCACGITVGDLRKPTSSAAIVLPRDYVEIINRDKRDDTRMLKGVRAGRYTLIGSDEKGRYFLNESPSMLTLVGGDVDLYQPGQALPQKVVERNQMPRTLGNGGFYIKDEGGSDAVQAFSLIEPMVSGIQYGLVGMALVNSGKGKIQVLPLPNAEGLAAEIRSQLQLR